MPIHASSMPGAYPRGGGIEERAGMDRERVGDQHLLCQADCEHGDADGVSISGRWRFVRENCGMTSPKWTIGPAINCGKNITNNAKSMKVWGSTLFL